MALHTHDFNAIGHTPFTGHLHLQDHIDRQRKHHWSEFQHNSELKYQVYKGDFTEQIAGLIKSQSKLEWHALEYLAREVLERTTQTYSGQTRRSFFTEVEDAEGKIEQVPDEGYAEVLKNHIDPDRSLDSLFAEVARLVQLIGVVIVRPWLWPIDPDERPKGKIVRNTILLPFEYVPLLDKWTGEKLVGIQYFQSVNQSRNRTSTVEHIFALDEEDMSFLTNKKIEEPGYVQFNEKGDIIQQLTGADYPYRAIDDPNMMILPFAVFKWKPTPNQFVNESAGDSLYSRTLVTSKLKIQKEWVLRNQSHKQIVLAGPGVDKLGSQIIDPTVPIVLPQSESGEFSVKTLDLQTDPKILQDEIDQNYQRELTERGWNLEEFRQSAQRQTAEAHRIANDGKRRFNDTVIEETMRPGERAYSEVLRIVWNHGHDPAFRDINTEARFGIDFVDPFRSDPFANHQEKTDLVKRNILSELDILYDHDPDITGEEAGLAKLKYNARINREAIGVPMETEEAIDNLPEPNLPIEEETT